MPDDEQTQKSNISNTSGGARGKKVKTGPYPVIEAKDGRPDYRNVACHENTAMGCLFWMYISPHLFLAVPY